MSSQRIILAFAIALMAVPNAAALEDVKGSHDHPLIKRYEGAATVRYVHTEFDESTVPLGKADGQNKLTQSVVVEGEVTRLVYIMPKGRSTLEVMRNYENELKGAGYKILFAGSKEEIGNIPRAVGWETPTYSIESQRILTAQLTRPKGNVHVVFYAIEGRALNRRVELVRIGS